MIFSLFLAYVQEIGRAGCDGFPSTARLFVNSSDVAANKKHMSDEMRQFVKLESCRRVYLNDYFGSAYTGVNDLSLHDCCDICRKNCDCSDCQLVVEADALVAELDTLDDTPSVPAACRQEAKSLLESYFYEENMCIGEGILLQGVTGLSTQLADKIVKKMDKFVKLDILADTFPNIRDHYLKNIVLILETCCMAYDVQF